MAEMGIYDNGNEDTQFFTDLDITFTMTGEADNGLTFGATIDLDEATDQPDFENPSVQGGENMFITYGGATLTMGDTDGALDARVPELALAGGSLADDETVHLGFNHSDGLGDFFNDPSDGLGLSLDGLGDGQVARFDYAYSDFTFSLSAEQLANGAEVSGTGETIWGLGVSWVGQVSMVDLAVGLGYQTLEDYADVTTIAATGGFANGFSTGLTYTSADFDDQDDNVEHVGVGFGYEMNAFAIGLNWGQYDFDGDTISGWGLAGTYDMGGGLEARMGYGKSEIDAFGIDDDYDTWSLGLRMNF